MFVPLWLIVLLAVWAVIAILWPVLSDLDSLSFRDVSVASAIVGVVFIVWLVLGGSNA